MDCLFLLFGKALHTIGKLVKLVVFRLLNDSFGQQVVWIGNVECTGYLNGNVVGELVDSFFVIAHCENEREKESQSSASERLTRFWKLPSRTHRTHYHAHVAAAPLYTSVIPRHFHHSSLHSNDVSLK